MEGRLQPKVDVRKRADAWVAFDSETMYMYMYTNLDTQPTDKTVTTLVGTLMYVKLKEVSGEISN